jgi:nucleoside-diphosphate-sugar epimerase
MTALPRLAVTGSTGALGGQVSRELAALGNAQWLLTRTPIKAPVLEEAVAVPFSYADRDAAAWVTTCTAIVKGELAGVTDTVVALTGRHRSSSRCTCCPVELSASPDQARPLGIELPTVHEVLHRRSVVA